VKDWANDVKDWAIEHGSGLNLGHLLSQIQASLQVSMLRFLLRLLKIAQPHAEDRLVIAPF
jgi:hypothetical protein